MQSFTHLASAALLALTLISRIASAQTPKVDDSASATQVVHAESQPPKFDPKPYLLTVVVKEWSGGKLVLDKNYALTVLAEENRHNFQNLRDGDRIPYMRDKDQAYEDVGTNIDADIVTRHGDAITVNLRVSSTSLAATPNPSSGSLPLITQWTTSLIAVLPRGKPTLVYSATDAISSHKVEIQATSQSIPAE